MKHVLWAIGIGLVSSILVIAVSETSLVKNWGYKTYDLRMMAAQKLRPTPQNVVMFYVDEPSLRHMEKQGIHWPWPRELEASALDFCRRGGARAVLFDIFFSEDSVYGVADDEAFAAGIAAGPPAYFVLFLSKNESENDPRADLIIKKSAVPFASGNLNFMPAEKSIQSLPVVPIVDTAAGFGNVQMPPDDDGIYRRIALIEKLGKNFIPSIPLKIASDTLKIQQIEWPKQSEFIFGETKIPLDDDGRLLINYYGGADTFPAYPLAKILTASAAIAEGKTPDVNPSVVKDKVVIIGVAAPGLYDLKPTPLAHVYPAPEIHATAIENLLTADFIYPIHKIPAALITIACGLAAAFALARTASSWGIGIWFGALILATAGAGTVLFRYGISMPIVPPIGAISIASFTTILKNYLTEGRKKREIKRAFGQYLSPDIVSEIAKNPEALALGGIEKEVTLFFSDIADFTTISETTKPSELVPKLNEYFSATSKIIQEFGGTLDKYIGDAIMAFWGAPLEVEDHATRCVLAALGIQKFLAGGSNFTTRIGIHTGRAVVGNIGSDVRFNYTAIGDTVNLASRLEGLNKQFGTKIIASEPARISCGGKIEARRIGKVRVKGRNEAIGIYEPLGEAGDFGRLGKDACARFEEALAHFESARFSDAHKIFGELAGKNGDATSQIYSDICEKYLREPPVNFDGVITFKTK